MGSGGSARQLRERRHVWTTSRGPLTPSLMTARCFGALYPFTSVHGPVDSFNNHETSVIVSNSLQWKKTNPPETGWLTRPKARSWLGWGRVGFELRPRSLSLVPCPVPRCGVKALLGASFPRPWVPRVSLVNTTPCCSFRSVSTPSADRAGTVGPSSDVPSARRRAAEMRWESFGCSQACWGPGGLRL